MFGVGAATAWRYATETVRLLADRAPKTAPALCAARKAGHAFVVIDGDADRHRPGRQRPADLPRQAPPPRHESAGHLSPVRRDPAVFGPLPGSVHDLTAARIWAIIRELAAAGLITLADKAYISAGEHV